MSSAISQRDLRMRSREIMDAVERGESFIVTRGGRGIGELIAAPRSRRFISRAEFAASSRHAVLPDVDRFRSDLDHVADGRVDDPFDR